jgi:WD40 repeat protein
MMNHKQLGNVSSGFSGPGGGPAVVLSPNRTFLAIAGCHTKDCTSGELQIWNAASHQFLGTPIITDLPLAGIAYSPDGKILAAYGDDRAANISSNQGRYGEDKIYFWEVATGRLLGSISSIASNNHSFAFIPGSDTLVAPYCAQFTGGACDHVQIGVWDAQNPTNRKQIISDAAMQYPDDLLVSPKGDILIASDHNILVFLWNIVNNRLIRKLNVGYSLASAKFTPDGTMLFTGSQLLDTNTLALVGPSLSVYTNYLVEGMKTSDDTNPLFGWSTRDGLVVSWNFNIDSWQSLACQMANRNLTHSEWKQFMGSTPYSKICPGLPGPSDA